MMSPVQLFNLELTDGVHLLSCSSGDLLWTSMCGTTAAAAAAAAACLSDRVTQRLLMDVGSEGTEAVKERHPIQSHFKSPRLF